MAEKFEYTREWTDAEAFPLLGFTKSWENPEDYPTIELDETQVRKDMQSLHDEVKDYINTKLIPAVLAEDATEAARAAAEAQRETNETQRIENENARIEAEGSRSTAEQARVSAETARGTAEQAREAAEQAREAAEQARADENTGIVARATEQANIASSAASSASNSASEASISKTAAQASKTAAAGSASAAANSATSASASASAASESADAAAASKTAAKSSEETAKASETAAKASETAAAESASAAQQSATSAAESAAVYESVASDVTQLKQDLVDETNRATNRENEIEELFTMPTQEAVNKWLNEHPEATTTVQDSSITMKKIKVGELKYVTPEMFGAVGDGVEDDTEAVRMALTHNVVLLNNSYIVSDKLELLSDTVIYGNGKVILTGGVGAQTASGYIYANEKENIFINGITIINNCDSGSNDKTIGFKDCENINVSNCTILNKGNRTGWTLVFWNVTKGTIFNNKIKGSDSYQLDDGIHVTGNNIEIIGNVVETIDDGIAVGYNSTTSIGGIQPTKSIVSQNIVISNNVVKCTEGGIHIYTYNAETTIKDIIISNNIIDARVIIRDDVQSVNNITISNITIQDCIFNDDLHSGKSSPIVLGNCKNVIISSCNIKNTKGIGVITGERNFSDVYISGCILINENPENTQYKAVINMGNSNNLTPNIIVTSCKIVTTGRVASGYFGSLTISKCHIENKGTSNDIYLQGLGDDGVKIIGNTIKTNANNIIAVGSLTSALFVFAYNVTNCNNPTYKIGASKFHEDFNFTGIV